MAICLVSVVNLTSPSVGSCSTLQQQRPPSKIPVKVSFPFQRQQNRSVTESGGYCSGSDSDYTGSCELTGSGSSDSSFECWRGHKLSTQKGAHLFKSRIYTTCPYCPDTRRLHAKCARFPRQQELHVVASPCN